MAALDFPVSPSIGTIYPNPPIGGAAVYAWDGEKWTSATGYGAIYMSDTPPTTAPTGSLWYETDTGLLFVRFFDGTSTQWVSIPGGIQDVIRYSVAQTLTAAQQVQARQNTMAASFDAMAYNGLQINGSCEVSQERPTGAAFAFTGSVMSHLHDMWKVRTASAGTWAFSGFPMYNSAPPGFTYCALLQASTVTTPATGDNASINMMIEGWRVARLAWGTANAQPITIGFWVYSNATAPAMFSVAVQNGTYNRTYNTTVSTSVTSSWEYRTITVPGDTGGTWDKTTGLGLQIMFCFMCGTGNQNTPGVWLANGGMGTIGQVNHFQANGYCALVTGVTVHPGLEAPSAARSPYIARSFEQELTLCQRYWQKSYAYGTLPGANTAQQGGIVDAAYCIPHTVEFKVAMRISPTMTVYDSVGNAGKIWYGADNITPTAVDNINDKRFKIYHGNSRAMFHYVADARL